MLKQKARIGGRVVAGRWLRSSGLLSRRQAAAARARGRELAVGGMLLVLVSGALAGGALVWRRRARRRWWPQPERFLRSSGRWAVVGASAVAVAGAVGAGYVLVRGRRRVRRVRDVMTESPRAVESSTLVRDAAALMKSEDVGSLPLVEHERLVGVVTARDLVMRVVAEGRDPQAVRVGEIASRDLVSTQPQQTLDQALRLMARHRVRRLPVVEGERLVGVVAQADLAREANAEQAGATIARISEPTSK